MTIKPAYLLTHLTQLEMGEQSYLDTLGTKSPMNWVIFELCNWNEFLDWWEVISGLDDDLALNRQQATILMNDDPGQRSMKAAIGDSWVNNFDISKLYKG